MAVNDLARGKTGTRSINASKALTSSTVAALPAASANTGRLLYCTNGAAGSPCLAYSNGTSWLRVLLGAAVAVS
jgi:hypothetical protein